VRYPFDPGGRSLNSPYTEADPQIAGRYIVFTSTRWNKQDVYLFDQVSQRLVDLPGLNALDAIAINPAISEDGNTIAFVATRRGVSDIYLYNRQTRQLQNLTTNLEADVRNPTISADGSTIAFESNANGQWDIFVYDRTGQPLRINDN
jgi:Tol biopolymer transport system component